MNCMCLVLAALALVPSENEGVAQAKEAVAGDDLVRLFARDPQFRLTSSR